MYLFSPALINRMSTNFQQNSPFALEMKVYFSINCRDFAWHHHWALRHPGPLGWCMSSWLHRSSNTETEQQANIGSQASGRSSQDQESPWIRSITYFRTARKNRALGRLSAFPMVTWHGSRGGAGGRTLLGPFRSGSTAGLGLQGSTPVCSRYPCLKGTLTSRGKEPQASRLKRTSRISILKKL